MVPILRSILVLVSFAFDFQVFVFYPCLPPCALPRVCPVVGRARHRWLCSALTRGPGHEEYPLQSAQRSNDDASLSRRDNRSWSSENRLRMSAFCSWFCFLSLDFAFSGYHTMYSMSRTLSRHVSFCFLLTFFRSLFIYVCVFFVTSYSFSLLLLLSVLWYPLVFPFFLSYSLLVLL